MGWVLLRNARVFAPEDLGRADLLVWEDRIVAVGPGLDSPTGLGSGETVDLSGRMLLPGLIDGHIHVMGASGLGGPLTRTTDLQIERIAGAGVTTVVSPLGADSLSRGLPALVMRAAALEQEGVSAYCYTGGWRYPVPTLTGDPQGDVALVDRVRGVKTAISEAMAPLQGIEELCRLAHAAWTGGRLAGKKAVLHAHVGDHPDGLEPLCEVARRTGIPADRLVATHVNRNPRLWRQALEYGAAGGSIDVTALQRPEAGHAPAIPPAQALREALDAGVPRQRITLSTDSGAAMPRLDGTGRAVGRYMPGPDALLQTIQELVKAGVSWGDAVAFCSAHPADLLGLEGKGRLAPGRDADLLVLSEAGTVDRVYGRGRLLVDRGRPVVCGVFGASATRTDG
jgi:beta-aspartyl-dipeptidase (metallo-type)